MIFRRVYFFLATFEKLASWLPKFLYIFFYLLIGAWVLYIVQFGFNDFIQKKLFYSPFQSIFYGFRYIAFVISNRYDISFVYFIYMLIYFILPYPIIKGLRNFFNVFFSSFFNDSMRFKQAQSASNESYIDNDNYEVSKRVDEKTGKTFIVKRRKTTVKKK